MKYNILLIEDEDQFREVLYDSLLALDTNVWSYSSWEMAEEEMRVNKPDLAILDINLPGKNGLMIFEELKNRFSEIEGIIITGQANLENSIHSIKVGVSDFLTKPFRLKELKNAIESLESYKQFQLRVKLSGKQLLNSAKAFEEDWGIEFIGISPYIKKVNMLMKKVAQSSDTTVLITGESGTGKELVAKGIHSLSGRNKAPFYPVNCTAIPDTLFESEFFGYQKGAFTGALTSHAGWFEKADSGTLFLDEIGDLNLALQAKLLRVLDEKRICRIGSHDTLEVNTRVVTATNKNLKELSETGLFRLDLYHRLNTFNIHLAPLRERTEDIPPLVHHFIKEYSEKQRKSVKSIHSRALNLLSGYHFPGNIRELKNIIERAVLLCDSSYISTKHIQLPEEGFVSVVDDQSFKLDEIEKNTIIKAIQSCKNNKTKAAHKLNITRQSLNRKLKKYSLE
ncbi:sigma-54-dependent Fis family transcriptional regulator [Marinilabiliaceae bacterium JC017]|nr:sigma-54-dependent Fis family transcriptional regulator [Marinilabiliaceae bacterium JC017]